MSLLTGILAVTGRILLGILFLLLILLALVLFVPVRYELSGKGDREQAEGDGKITWLLHFISLCVHYAKAGDESTGPDISFRICGISPREVKKKLILREPAKRKAGKKKQIEALKKSDPEKYRELRDEALRKKQEREAEKQRREQEEAEKAAKAGEEAAAEENASPEDRKEKLRILMRRAVLWAAGVIRRAAAKFFALSEKLFGGMHMLFLLPAVITDRIFKIVSKLQDICDTISKWTGFIGDPRTKGAVRVVKKRFLHVLRHVWPRRLSGAVSFGFEDPAVTGEVLAAASALYPLCRERLLLDPDFSGKRLEGNVSAKGRIILAAVAWQALMVIASRDVRFVWRTWKQMRSSGEKCEARRKTLF